jgi:hypothetical protein
VPHQAGIAVSIPSHAPMTAWCTAGENAGVALRGLFIINPEGVLRQAHSSCCSRHCTEWLAALGGLDKTHWEPHEN